MVALSSTVTSAVQRKEYRICSECTMYQALCVYIYEPSIRHTSMHVIMCLENGFVG